MEAKDREEILKVVVHDRQLARLYQKHREFEQRLEGYQYKTFLTQKEQLIAASLKKLKLHGVDQMMDIMARYQQAA